jgi:anti-sigma B factor antagonist
MSEGDIVRAENRDGVVVARIVGEVDLSNAPRVEALLARAVPNDAVGVVVDLSETTYLDSSGVSLVFQLAEQLQTRQQQMRVAAPDDAPLRRVLRVVNLESVVPISPSADEAVEEIRKTG